MKTQRLQAAFARKREAELMRIEKTTAVNRYFDHWGKVTSRFENWTTPEYYEQAEESLRKSKEKKVKEQILEERRHKLRELLCQETKTYEEEINLLKKPKTKRISTDVLEKIDKNLKNREDERRRLELESKLYSRWRYGLSDENILYESKKDNQILAKLNWLDKQIEDQMEREKQKEQSEMRTLRLQEEARKREEYLKESQIIRESEIKELRSMQENHLKELKSREAENNSIQAEEEYLRKVVDDLRNELSSFELRKQNNEWDISVPHNVKKIKMIIRKRSESFRQGLRDDIDLLKRISAYCTDDYVRHLIEKFEMHFDLEIQNQSQIEAMYESEAKHSLVKWEQLWGQQSAARKAQLVNLLEKLKTKFKEKLSENIKQQKHLIEVRETHLSAIENSNEKLRILIKEQESSQELTSTTTAAAAVGKSDKENCKEISEQFSNCSMNIGCPAVVVMPKFGRKKVAWT